MQGLIDLEMTVARQDVLLAISPEFVDERASQHFGYAGRVASIGLGFYVFLAKSRKGEIIDETEVAGWFAPKIMSGIEECAALAPRETATLLQASRETSLGYLFAHGFQERGRWYLCLDDQRDVVLRPKLLDHYEEVGGWIIESCNQGEVNPFEGMRVPVLYPVTDTSHVVRNQETARYGWEPASHPLASTEHSRKTLKEFMRRTKRWKKAMWDAYKDNPTVQREVLDLIDRTHQRKLDRTLGKLGEQSGKGGNHGTQ